MSRRRKWLTPRNNPYHSQSRGHPAQNAIRCRDMYTTEWYCSIAASIREALAHDISTSELCASQALPFSVCIPTPGNAPRSHLATVGEHVCPFLVRMRHCRPSLESPDGTMAGMHGSDTTSQSIRQTDRQAARQTIRPLRDCLGQVGMSGQVASNNTDPSADKPPPKVLLSDQHIFPSFTRQMAEL